MNAFKDYLGDSVYAEFDGHHIVLTTDNGFGASNTIFLESAVLKALDNYRERLKQHLAASNPPEP